MTGVPGFSGSPVILADTGEVIGIVFGPGRTDRRFDLEWATPVTREDLERSLHQHIHLENNILHPRARRQ